MLETFKQLWNKLSFHDTPELNQKTIKVVAKNKTYWITTESLRNQITSYTYWHFEATNSSS